MNLKKTIKKMSDSTGVTQEKIVMFIIVILLFLLVIAIDVFAFGAGSVATISQVFLTINRKYYNLLSFFLAIVAGGLITHFSIPENPDGSPMDPLWRFLGICLLCFVAGSLLVFYCPALKQYPNLD
jgi:hypothetical protein